MLHNKNIYKYKSNKKYTKIPKELIEEYKLVKQAQLMPDKFEILYNKYYKQIFVFIYNRTDDKEITADICSQVFLKAMLNIKSYRFIGVPFSAWLFRIAINEVNSFYRKFKKERTISIDEQAFDFISENLELTNKESDKEKMLFELLEGLNEKQMQIIELRFFEQRSFKEIAVILDISVENAKVKVHRILKKLKSSAIKFRNFLISIFAKIIVILQI